MQRKIQWNRWKNRLLVVAAVVFGLQIGIPAFNHYVLFRASIPRRFYEAQWEGTWKSTKIRGVSGNIIAKLPDPIPIKEEFPVEAWVYYNLWSPYRSGQGTQMEMVGYFDIGQSGSGENLTSPVNVPPPSFSLEIRKFSGVSQLYVDYTASIDQSQSNIVGGYRSGSSPRSSYDMGWFFLQKR